jgi:UDP-N-acetyl-D-galactosamine dehydrogenase
LARLFSTKFPTIEYDINTKRVDERKRGLDSTFEVKDALLQEAIADGFFCIRIG